MTAVGLGVLLIAYTIRFGADAFTVAALGVNAVIAFCAGVFAWMVRMARPGRAPAVAESSAMRRKSPAVCATEEV